MIIVQKRNDELVAGLTPDFVRRAESTYAWKSVCSMYQAIPGLRGFWPMSSIDGDGDCNDLSENGLVLSNNGDLDYDIDNLAPIIDVNGTGEYLSRADQAEFDVLATETYIQTAKRGLSLGIWANWDALNTGAALMSKWLDNTNNRSYLLNVGATDMVEFNISSLGTAASSVSVASTAAPTWNLWYFIVGRFTVGAELKLWVNADTFTQATAAAAVFNSNAPFYIARRDTGAAQIDFNGQFSLAFLSAMALPDYLINALFQHSRRIFNV